MLHRTKIGAGRISSSYDVRVDPVTSRTTFGSATKWNSVRPSETFGASKSFKLHDGRSNGTWNAGASMCSRSVLWKDQNREAHQAGPEGNWRKPSALHFALYERQTCVGAGRRSVSAVEWPANRTSWSLSRVIRSSRIQCNSRRFDQFGNQSKRLEVNSTKVQVEAKLKLLRSAGEYFLKFNPTANGRNHIWEIWQRRPLGRPI